MNKFITQFKLRKEMEKQVSTRMLTRDKDNRVIINMLVKDDSNFLSEFSKTETPIISNDVADFLEDSTHSLLPSEQFVLNIESNCIDKKEKGLYEKAIREYYTERYIVNERELKRNRVIVKILAFLGVIVLATSIFIDVYLDRLLWSALIDIVAWVLLWEAVDIAVFQCHSLKIKRAKYLAFISIKINFKNVI